MNQRIRDLAEQCRMEIEHFSSDDGYTYTEGFDKEKFAVLIVAECTDLVQKYMSRWPEDHELTKQIKEHFGVEA